MSSTRFERIINPITVSVLLVAVLAVFYGLMLSEGTFNHGDEYLTLDRTHSFTIRDNWLSVYSENRPTFKKPPLQYWMGALLLDAGVNTEVALRLPSLFFAIGVLLLTGLLARIILPENPWVTPIAILLMACSKRFWENATSALLDAGATFFAVSALTATYAAIRQPRWWYVVALACGLGALQKAPIPVLFSLAALLGVVVTASRHDLPLGRSLKSPHFILSLVIGLVLVLLWPAIQWLSYGSESFQQAYLDQIVERFSPFGEEMGHQRSTYTLLVASEPFLRIPAFIALFWMPWRLHRMELVGLPAMIALYALIVLGSSGIVSPRYSLMFLPVLMASLAVMVLAVLPDWRQQAAVVAVLCLASLGPLKTAGSLGISDSKQAKLVAMMMDVGDALRPEETLLVCRKGEGRDPIHPGAVSFFSSAGRPFYRLRSAEHFQQLQDSDTIRPPYRVLCGNTQFKSLSPLMAQIDVVETNKKYTHWTAARAPAGK